MIIHVSLKIKRNFSWFFYILNIPDNIYKRFESKLSNCISWDYNLLCFMSSCRCLLYILSNEAGMAYKSECNVTSGRKKKNLCWQYGANKNTPLLTECFKEFHTPTNINLRKKTCFVTFLDLLYHLKKKINKIFYIHSR